MPADWVQDAIAHGTAYIPPESPTPEGMRGTDTGPGELGMTANGSG